MKQEKENNQFSGVKKDLLKSLVLSIFAIGIVIIIYFLRR